MSCLLTNEELNQYLDGALRAAERERVEAHLLTCRECGEKYDTLFQLVQNLRGLQALKAREDTADRVLNSIRAGSLILDPPARRNVTTFSRFPGVARFAAAACVLLAVTAFALKLQRDSRHAADVVDTVTVPSALSSVPADEHSFGKGSVEIDLTGTAENPSAASSPSNAWSADATLGIDKGEGERTARELKDQNRSYSDSHKKTMETLDGTDNLQSPGRDTVKAEENAQRDAKGDEQYRESRALREAVLRKENEEPMLQAREEALSVLEGPERTLLCKVEPGKRAEVRERLLAGLNADATDGVAAPQPLRDEANAPAPMKARSATPPTPEEKAPAETLESTRSGENDEQDLLFAFLIEIDGVLDVSVRQPVTEGRDDDVAPEGAEAQGGGGAPGGRLPGDALKGGESTGEAQDPASQDIAKDTTDSEERAPAGTGEANEGGAGEKSAARIKSESVANRLDDESTDADQEAMDMAASETVRRRDAERRMQIQSRVEILEVTETAIRLLFDGREIEILLSE